MTRDEDEGYRVRGRKEPREGRRQGSLTNLAKFNQDANNRAQKRLADLERKRQRRKRG